MTVATQRCFWLRPPTFNVLKAQHLFGSLEKHRRPWRFSAEAVCNLFRIYPLSNIGASSAPSLLEGAGRKEAWKDEVVKLAVKAWHDASRLLACAEAGLHGDRHSEHYECQGR